MLPCTETGDDLDFMEEFTLHKTTDRDFDPTGGFHQCGALGSSVWGMW